MSMIGSAACARLTPSRAMAEAVRNSRRVSVTGHILHEPEDRPGMFLVRLRAIAVFLAAAAAVAYGAPSAQRSPSNRPWPPDVQKVGPESPPLAPEEALKT